MRNFSLLILDYDTKSRLLEDDKFLEILKGISGYFQGLYRFEILAFLSWWLGIKALSFQMSVDWCITLLGMP